MQTISNEDWVERCRADGEFRLAARHWDGALAFGVGDTTLALEMADGEPSLPTATPTPGAGYIGYSADEGVWEKLLAAVPERFHNDFGANMAQQGGISRDGDPVTIAQYYAASMRALELLRPESATPKNVTVPASAGSFAAPTGRYVHVPIDGHLHRIYFEEAGTGIPLLMQHTAGCHSSQWRHLFEVPEITDRFRLIAYDLPFHGKSMPPESRDWWAETYDLRGDFLRSVPRGLSEALDLDRPVFMGCSVGGLLALDLAWRHADEFRAVISVEGALNIEGHRDMLGELWHPQVSNEYKARLMEGLMSPTSPQCYRKETSFVYASGWPPVFLGDLCYYIDDYDLRPHAGEVDTNRVGVHILSGEYDYSGTTELGREAHEAITGSTFTEMKGVGHFPMSENPAAFIEALLPVLKQIA